MSTLKAKFQINAYAGGWGNITGNIQNQTDLQEELSSISGGLSEDINALDNKYDSITGALDDKIDGVDNKLDGVDDKIDTHISNKSNPHSVTKSQVGLGNADNTSDLNKPISNATQNALNTKQATITGAASTITTNDLTASRVLISNSSGKVAVSGITSTELNYLDNVTGDIQTQLNNKLQAEDYGTIVINI